MYMGSFLIDLKFILQSVLRILLRLLLIRFATVKLHLIANASAARDYIVWWIIVIDINQTVRRIPRRALRQNDISFESLHLDLRLCLI